MSQLQTPQPPRIAPPPLPAGVVDGTNRAAKAALICALIAIVIWPVGTAAVVLGIIGLVRAKQPGVRGRGMAIAGIVVGICGPAIPIGALMLWLYQNQDQAHRTTCAANLRQIAKAAVYYSNENKSRVPPNFLALMEYDVHLLKNKPSGYLCPAADGTPAAADGAEWYKALNPGSANCTYVYSPPAETRLSKQPNPSRVVLLYHAVEIHKGEGTNFAFADGRVQWISEPAASQAISELKAGQNPPPSLAGAR